MSMVIEPLHYPIALLVHPDHRDRGVGAMPEWVLLQRLARQGVS